ncbi:DUF2568 domain-containing protein [bacterium]|nr:DUF2568 domain-containing protein [bacterium]
MQILLGINNGVSFLLELTALAAFGYWGFHTGRSDLMKWVLGIGAPLVMIVFWALFMAPRSSNRLNATAGIIVSSVIFLLAAATLYFSGVHELAVILAVVVVVNQVLVVAWQQW